MKRTIALIMAVMLLLSASLSLASCGETPVEAVCDGCGETFQAYERNYSDGLEGVNDINGLDGGVYMCDECIEVFISIYT